VCNLRKTPEWKPLGSDHRGQGVSEYSAEKAIHPWVVRKRNQNFALSPDLAHEWLPRAREWPSSASAPAALFKGPVQSAQRAVQKRRCPDLSRTAARSEDRCRGMDLSDTESYSSRVCDTQAHWADLRCFYTPACHDGCGTAQKSGSSPQVPSRTLAMSSAGGVRLLDETCNPLPAKG